MLQNFFHRCIPVFPVESQIFPVFALLQKVLVAIIDRGVDYLAHLGTRFTLAAHCIGAFD